MNNEPTIQELEDFFNNIELPKENIVMSPSWTIDDAELFVSSSIAAIKHYKGKQAFRPYYIRLIELKNKLI